MNNLCMDALLSDSGRIGDVIDSGVRTPTDAAIPLILQDLRYTEHSHASRVLPLVAYFLKTPLATLETALERFGRGQFDRTTAPLFHALALRQQVHGVIVPDHPSVN